MKLYCLSGLGVDKRAFQNVNPKEVELIHIVWIEPIPNETLESYAIRLFDVVKPEDNYNLIGVSFGGMIATEFAKLKKPNKLILVSTINSSSELSRLFKFGGAIKFHKVIPTRLLTKTNMLTNYMFGVQVENDKRLLKEILLDTNPNFLKWAINAIANWKNYEIADGIRIHGTKDKILPYRKDVDYSIEKGGHFVIVSHGNEISQIIDKNLNQIK